MPISFDLDRDLLYAVRVIVDRTIRLAREMHIPYERMECHMDIVACHANGTPLDLVALSLADDTTFAHDVLGIRRHISRQSGQLLDHFLPRTALPQVSRFDNA